MPIIDLKILWLYITVFITGAAVLVIEILGTRILAPFYGSTVFVWSSLISVTLSALALGYWYGGRLADRRPAHSLLYATIFLSGLAVFLIPKLDQQVLLLTDRFGLRFGPLAASALLFGLSLFLLGMISPFMIRLRTHLAEKSGEVAGNIFAIGTIGSLAGALLSGFFLIPLLSVTSIFNSVALILVVVAVLGLGLFGFRAKQAIVLGTLALISIILPSFDLEKDPRILLQKQSFYGDLKVVHEGFIRCIYVDATAQSCINLNTGRNDSVYRQRVELLFRENRYENVLILGLGGGVILSFIPEYAHVTAVELDSEIADLARQFDIMPDRDIDAFYGDARQFIRQDEKSYDLIIVDLFRGGHLPPYMFSEEALTDMRRLLSSHGIVFFNGGIPRDDEFKPLTSALFTTFQRAFDDQVSLISTTPATGDLSFIAYHEKPILSGALAEVDYNQFLVTSEIIRDDFNTVEFLSLGLAREVLNSVKEPNVTMTFVQ